MSAAAGTRDAALLALKAAHEAAEGLEDATEAEAAAALEMSRTLTGYSTAHALLAIEARLGELVDQQQLANMLAAFHGAGNAYYLDDAGIEHDDIVVWISRRLHSVVDPEVKP